MQLAEQQLDIPSERTSSAHLNSSELATFWLQLLFLSSFYSYTPDPIKFESPAAYAVLWSGHTAPAAGTLLDPLNMFTENYACSSWNWLVTTTSLGAKNYTSKVDQPPRCSTRSMNNIPTSCLELPWEQVSQATAMLLKHAAQSSPATAHVQGPRSNSTGLHSPSALPTSPTDVPLPK